MPPNARNGPNGIAVLRPSAAPLRAMIATPMIEPARSADEQRDADLAAEEQAHDERQLDVPHAHAGRVGDRGDEEEPPGRKGGDQVLRDVRRAA